MALKEAGLFLAAGSALIAGLSGTPSGAPKRDYPNDIEPLLRAHCTPCHNGDVQKGALRLDSPEALRKGGVSGSLWKKGDPKISLLVQRLRGELDEDQMPLGFAPLSEAKIRVFEEWIRQGAPLGGKKRLHWSYSPPKRAPLPSVKLKGWAKGPVDLFLLARMEEEGLAPNPPASKETLLRRLSLDLTGLPPTVAEQDEFLNDTSSGAVERVVDRLLASPRFGERMAQPWLDLARFADSNGYEKDRNRNAWPYRDWVIQAFNKDIPYPRFIEEQIAGDLLPDRSKDTLIATGFQRNTMHNEEGGVDQGEQRWLTLVDRVAVTGTAFLATSIACAQCHDHKYDPVQMEDFYRMLAFYESSNEPTLLLDQNSHDELAMEASRLQKDLTQNIGKPEEAETKAKIAELEGKMRRMRETQSALILQEDPAKKAETPIRQKGAYLSPGEMVSADTPAFLGRLGSDQPKNRLGLAKWLGSRENPLTARVAVNRAWEMLFGVGLVKTSDDFGTQGESPSHPELLDWLAVEFMEKGWSIKSLLRTLVLSSAYQQSSRMTPETREKDPENRLVARGPRFRLPAEHIRDSTLSAAGLLSGKIGGPSVMPDQPEGVWNTPYNDEKWTVSQGEDRWRRSLYTHWKRSSPYPFFMAFDATSREACTSRRINTNTPLQALALMNDTGVLESAKALAKSSMADGSFDFVTAFRRVLCRHPKAEELAQLKKSYSLLVQSYLGSPEKAAKAAWPGASPSEAAAVLLCQTLLMLDEAITKE